MAAPVEPELYCPHCRYNLRGLPEDRCPECGRPFDRAQLLALADPTPREPVDEDGQRLRPLRIAWLAATAPRRLARLVPPRPDGPHGAACSVTYDFLAIVTLVVGLVFLSAASPHWDYESSTVFAAAAGLGGAFGAWLCETLTAAVLALIVRPVGIPTRYRFWRAMTHYTGGFLVLTAGWCVPMGLVDLVDALEDPALTGLWILGCYCAALGIYGWWTVALGRMILTRAEPGWRAWLGCALVPLVGAASIFASGFLVALFVIGCLSPF